jgi:hypothetical protein
VETSVLENLRLTALGLLNGPIELAKLRTSTIPFAAGGRCRYHHR